MYNETNSNIDNQTNELTSQPNVSNSDRLPEKTKGKIVEICSNPQIEAKRQTNHNQVMKGNSYALRTGKYSKLHPIPNYVLDYLDYIDDLSLDNDFDFSQAMGRLIKGNLKRLTIQEELTLQNGEVGNKQLNQLSKDTFVMLQITQTMKRQEPENNAFDFSIIRNLSEEEQGMALSVVRRALQELREGKLQSALVS